MIKMLQKCFILTVVVLCYSVDLARAEEDKNVTVVNRTCISEPDVPEFTLPPGVCKGRNDSCKHEVVKFDDGTEIMCDTETDGGGWLVFQRRLDKSSVFPGDWKDFVAGFGDIRKNFWFGLDKVHQLCPPKRPCELRVDVVLDSGQEAFATYDYFSLTGGFDNYKINVRNFSGQGNIMGPTDGAPFISRNGPSKKELPACLGKQDGWWHQANCTTKTLNGKMDMGYTEMKIRRGEPGELKQTCKVKVHFFVDSSIEVRIESWGVIKLFLKTFTKHFNMKNGMGDTFSLTTYGTSDRQPLTIVGSASTTAEVTDMVTQAKKGSKGYSIPWDALGAMKVTKGKEYFVLIPGSSWLNAFGRKTWAANLKALQSEIGTEERFVVLFKTGAGDTEKEFAQPKNTFQTSDKDAMKNIKEIIYKHACDDTN